MTAPQPADGALPLRILAVLALLACFGPLATDTYLSAFADMKPALGASDTGIAASISVFIFGLATGQLLYGPLSDRFGRKPPLLAGTALFTVSSALAAFAQGIEWFLLLRLMQAVGGCCGIILGRAIVRDLREGPELARAYSLLSMIGMGAPLVAPVLGLAVIQLAGWRAIFVGLAVLGLACLAAIAFLLPETLVEARRQRSVAPVRIARSFAALLARPRFLFAALTTGSAAGVIFSNVTGSSAAFIGQFGLSRGSYATLFTAIVVAMMAGSQLNRRAVARGTPPAALVTRALTANLFAAVGLFPAALLGVWPMFAMLLLVTALLGFILPNSAAAAMNEAGDHAGSAASLLGVIQFGSGFAVSLIVAGLQNGSAWPMLGGMAGSMALGALAWRA